jgi:hypothetical protein
LSRFGGFKQQSGVPARPDGVEDVFGCLKQPAFPQDQNDGPCDSVCWNPGVKRELQSPLDFPKRILALGRKLTGGLDVVPGRHMRKSSDHNTRLLDAHVSRRSRRKANAALG